MSRQVGKRLPRVTLALLAAVPLLACSQTTRVGDETAAGDLVKSNKAVAVMRIGAASPACQHVGVWLGTREGNGFRPVKPVAVINHRSLTEVPVAETELHPGEYHVISYACGGAGGVKQVSDPGGGGLVRTSYASFTLGPGEIVNVGSFEFHTARTGTNAFGRPLRTTITITDWPLDELDRYKEKRPHLYAQMKTRLMTPTPRGPADPGEDDCQRLATLQAEGKIQNLPAACKLATADAKPR